MKQNYPEHAIDKATLAEMIRLLGTILDGKSDSSLECSGSSYPPQLSSLAAVAAEAESKAREFFVNTRNVPALAFMLGYMRGINPMQHNRLLSTAIENIERQRSKR